MLVKINKDHYVNTDHVIRVFFLGTTADVFTTSHDEYGSCYFNVPAVAAAYLLEMMNAQSAIILPGEPGYADLNGPPENAPLTSRIAQLLRDELIEGASVDQLMEMFKLDYHLIRKAVDALLSEDVIVYGNNDTTYHHATHKPNAPQPVYPTEFPDPLPFRQMIREGKLQCCECSHQGCNDCADSNACCRCNCPSFTALASEIFPTSEQLRN